jgi:hypothetical protein
MEMPTRQEVIPKLMAMGMGGGRDWMEKKMENRSIE